MNKDFDKDFFKGFNDIKPNRSLVQETHKKMQEDGPRTSHRPAGQRRIKKFYIALTVSFSVVVGMLAFNQQQIHTRLFPTIVASNVEALPVVGDDQNLKKLLSESVGNELVYGGGGRLDQTLGASDQTKSAAPTSSAALNGATYSGTNLQVEGVDEADIVKTDGTYLYQLNSPQLNGPINLFTDIPSDSNPVKTQNTSEVVISKIYPASDLQVVSRIEFNEDKFSPRELYVDSKRLIVLGTTYELINSPDKTQNDAYTYGEPITKVLIYDIKDKANPQRIREVKLDGNYISSRKIGSALYFVANKNINSYGILQQNQVPTKPSYFDSNSQERYREIDFSQIHYFPETISPSYLMVAGIDLDHSNKEVQVSSYLGSGRNIYASASNLYVAMPHYEYEQASITNESATKDTIIRKMPLNKTTRIYKFGFKQGEAVYKGKGEVPGQILNQFSMDENEDYFRIATTQGAKMGNNQSTNNVYILDQNLKLSGSLEGLAPGEKIYSVRFMGDRAYMVTFKTVDPLFVLDLKDPKQPKTLGELKIPGYSDYLQPYDENHLIGIGKETVERVGQQTTIAFYLGMKLAMFDVSDVANPKELFKETIGDRGTDSEVLRNHKALLFDKEKNLLAFPVSVYETSGPQQKNTSTTTPPQYGNLTFQGAFVYHVNLEQGFSLKGKITHIDSTTEKSPQSSIFSQTQAIRRIIYVGQNLYTISVEKIKVNDLNTLEQKAELDIP